MDALSNLKQQIITEFENYIKLLNIGHQPNRSSILNKINFIEVCSNLSNRNRLYEFLINN